MCILLSHVICLFCYGRMLMNLFSGFCICLSLIYTWENLLTEIFIFTNLHLIQLATIWICFFSFIYSFDFTWNIDFDNLYFLNKKLILRLKNETFKKFFRLFLFIFHFILDSKGIAVICLFVCSFICHSCTDELT